MGGGEGQRAQQVWASLDMPQCGQAGPTQFISLPVAHIKSASSCLYAFAYASPPTYNAFPLPNYHPYLPFWPRAHLNLSADISPIVIMVAITSLLILQICTIHHLSVYICT